MASGTVHVCQQCGYQARKWLGRCPECASWGSLVEEVAPAPSSAPRLAQGAAAAPLPYPEIPCSEALRASSGVGELDRVLGGGIVPGAVILVGGEPGIGKSTLLLQAASEMAASGRKVLYATGEESLAQLRLRGDRLGVRSRELLVLSETDVERLSQVARETGAAALVVDSIQSVCCADLASAAGSVAQVRECAGRLVALAKTMPIAVFLVGHVTKDGALAGPRVLEHMVDTVIHFEGDRRLAHRLLRSQKNRFGPSDELAVFSMSESGLHGVTSPSELFLAERPTGAPGSAVLPAIEGSRPLLVEIQALVGESMQESPRRTALGVDANRLAMILAVLERRAGLSMACRDVFVNVTGGLAVLEPASDLAVCLAAASSFAGVPIPERWVILGEIGLTGEIRAVTRTEARLREASRLGFTGAVVPGSVPSGAGPEGMSLFPVRHLSEALEAFLARERGVPWLAGSPAGR